MKRALRSSATRVTLKPGRTQKSGTFGPLWPWTAGLGVGAWGDSAEQAMMVEREAVKKRNRGMRLIMIGCLSVAILRNGSNRVLVHPVRRNCKTIYRFLDAIRSSLGPNEW